jgi:hypothetical protein
MSQNDASQKRENIKCGGREDLLEGRRSKDQYANDKKGYALENVIQVNTAAGLVVAYQ